MYSRFAGIGVGHAVQFTSLLNLGSKDREDGIYKDASDSEAPESGLDEELGGIARTSDLDGLSPQSNHSEGEEGSSDKEDENDICDGQSDEELDVDNDQSDSDSEESADFMY